MKVSWFLQFMFQLFQYDSIDLLPLIDDDK